MCVGQFAMQLPQILIEGNGVLTPPQVGLPLIKKKNRHKMLEKALGSKAPNGQKKYADKLQLTDMKKAPGTNFFLSSEEFRSLAQRVVGVRPPPVPRLTWDPVA